MALNGCATSNNQPQILSDEEAKAGPYPPLPTSYKTFVTSDIASNLKDPDSVEYRSWTVARAYRPSNPPQFGYIISVTVNAKNSFGGYTGYDTSMYWYDGTEYMPIEQTEPFMPKLVDLVEY
jgi:hypothetical protein